MDPALWEMLEGNADDEVEAIVRFAKGDTVPPGVRLVARFGEIATCRLRRGDIREVRAHEDVASLKAPRYIVGDPRPLVPSAADQPGVAPLRRPPVPETGRNVVVGIVDWGADVTHPDFRHPDGTTRLLALWDQRGRTAPTDTNPYGKGVIHTREDINRALDADDPFEALDYDPSGEALDGAHGTHVMSIAAGNGRGGGPEGVAPDADLVFVQLSAGATGGLANFGDSVGVLEAVDFVLRQAEGRPCCINLSMGKHGGPHDGTTLVEQALDTAVGARPGFAIVQSTGNYFNRRVHAAGRLQAGETRVLGWQVDRADVTPDELEVWYASADTLRVSLRSPEGDITGPVPLGEHMPIDVAGREVGRLYHRAHDPNNADHHVDIFLDPGAAAGRWELELVGETVADGRYHAWIERDAGTERDQSRFVPEDAEPRYTTGTIANGFRTIAVGAYDAASVDRELAPFSSSGPTRDGRQKPDLVAPGVGIRAARSSSMERPDAPLLTDKSGTSMAAPHVTGTVALMLEAAGGALDIDAIRDALFNTADPPADHEARLRVGHGYLNSERAVARTRTPGAARVPMRATAPAVVPSTVGAYATPDEWDERRQDMDAGETSELDYAPADTYREDEPFDAGTDLDAESWDSERIAGGADQIGAEFPDPYAPVAARPAGVGGASPALVFDTFVHGGPPGIARRLHEEFEVLARPGEFVPADLRPDDVLITRALGEGCLAHTAHIGARNPSPPRLIAEGTYLNADALLLRARTVDSDASSQGLSGIVSFPTSDVATQNSIEFSSVEALGPRLSVHIRNRWLRWDRVAGAEMTLEGVGLPPQISNPRGTVRFDLRGVPDGTYTLRVDPPHVTEEPPGPAIVAAGPRPARVWRPLEAQLTVRGHRVIRSDNPLVTLVEAPAPGHLLVELDPVWIASHHRGRGRGGYAPSLVVLHGTNGPAAVSVALRSTPTPAINHFLSAASRVSAHYIIARDGSVVKMVHEDDRANHAGVSSWRGIPRRDNSVNDASIGIELVTPSGQGPYTDAQYDTLIPLLRAIVAHFGIPPTHIVGHADIASFRGRGTARSDPGIHFDWPRLERVGLGIQVGAPLSDEETRAVFAGYFADPAAELQRGDRDRLRRFGGVRREDIAVDLVQELQTDLSTIGYRLRPDGIFLDQTEQAVRAFKRHFFAGTRRRLPWRLGDPPPRPTGVVDAETAMMIKRVRRA